MILCSPAACWDEKLIVALDWTVIKRDGFLVCVHWQCLQTRRESAQLNFNAERTMDRSGWRKPITSPPSWARSRCRSYGRTPSSSAEYCHSPHSSPVGWIQCVWVLAINKKKKHSLIAKMLVVSYCVIYSAEPCWVAFCRKVTAHPWWPWWFCRWSFPAVESRRRSVMPLLCFRHHTRHINVGQTFYCCNIDYVLWWHLHTLTLTSSQQQNGVSTSWHCRSHMLQSFFLPESLHEAWNKLNFNLLL